MTLKTADRVFETSTSTGTGALILAGPVAGFQSFIAGVGTGAKVPYTIIQGNSWEIGIGTVTAGSPDTLARNTVLESTNADAAVNFGAGTKNVYLGFQAKIVPIRDENLNFVEGFGTVGGAANALTMAMPVPSKGYSDTMIIRGYALFPNTGPVVINVDGGGDKPIKLAGADLPPSTFLTGTYFEGVYKTSLGYFDLKYPLIASPASVSKSLGVLFRSKAPAETSNATDINNDITIAADISFVTDEGTVIKSVAMTKQQDATWVAGNNVGGMQAGSAKANNQTIGLYIIYNPTTLAVDYKFVPDGTAFVAASGFSEKRRIASYATDATGNIRPFIQRGDYFEYLTPIIDVNDASPVSTAVTKSLSVPKGLKLNVTVNASITNSGAGGYAAAYLSSLDSADLAPSLSATPLATIQTQDGGNSSNIGGQVNVWTNTAGQIRTRVASGNNTFVVATIGYMDRRGRDD
ncbi:hypothetical protein [Dyadobacter sp. CY356]|uniref:hypothetical protein n=1 Tax=Dyadobacter sp. CY356 TaxID=2906442 RepID=UPI001F235A52|nr:hypothetical protein [Dyadobacter sp. CY356]MCF0055508.1 hypothetical protein [Dyadobacter sp. CY356]